MTTVKKNEKNCRRHTDVNKPLKGHILNLICVAISLTNMYILFCSFSLGAKKELKILRADDVFTYK